MQVTKLGVAGEGPVPAGRYFAAIAENLRAPDLRASAHTSSDAAARPPPPPARTPKVLR